MEETQSSRSRAFAGKKELTFENFVTGDSNYVAFSAAKEVAQSPGTKYNPFFMFCDVGQGKTHLLHAIGWEFLKARPDGIVQLINGDSFSEELSEVSDRKLLRDGYIRSDLLLADDFHLLTDQARLEILRIFEALQAAKGQLVLTSLRAPEELDMDDRLRSRIEGGLVCKILPPDMATRVGILRKKAEAAGVSIKEGVLEDIARKVTLNVRKLEGAVNRLVVLSRARDEMISADFAASALRDIMPEFPAETRPMYEAPAEGGESEFSDFVSDVAKTLARISPEPSEEAKLREAYAQKLYVWEMKGFVVDRLKAAIDKKMDVLAREFVTFTSDVQRLIELQNTYGSLNAKRFPEEAAVIEKLLFDPSGVEEVRRRINDLEARLSAVSPDLVEDYSFDRFVVEPSNEAAFRLMKSIAESPYRGRVLVFLWGGEGSGKSHLVNALAREIRQRNSRLDVFLLHGELFVEDLKIERGRHARGRLRQRCAGADVLLVDDVRLIFENSYATDEFMTILDLRVLEGRKVVLVSDEPPERTTSDPGFARLVSDGSVARIGSPSSMLKNEIARQYLSRKVVEFSEADVAKTCESVGDNLWVLMDKLDQMVSGRQAKALVLEGTTIVEVPAEPEISAAAVLRDTVEEALAIEEPPKVGIEVPPVREEEAAELSLESGTEIGEEALAESREAAIEPEPLQEAEEEEMWIPRPEAPPLLEEDQYPGIEEVTRAEEPPAASVEEVSTPETWMPTPEAPPSFEEKREGRVLELEPEPLPPPPEAPAEPAKDEAIVLEEEAPGAVSPEEKLAGEEPPQIRAEEMWRPMPEARPLAEAEPEVVEEGHPAVEVSEEEARAPSWEPGRQAPGLEEIFGSGLSAEAGKVEEKGVAGMEEVTAGEETGVVLTGPPEAESVGLPPVSEVLEKEEPLLPAVEEVGPAGPPEEVSDIELVTPLEAEVPGGTVPSEEELKLERTPETGEGLLLPAGETSAEPPPGGVELEPLPGEEESRRRESRPADEIIDSTWEMDGERLMEEL